jgi:hypothetical protein
MVLCKTHKRLYVQLASIDAHKCRLERKKKILLNPSFFFVNTIEKLVPFKQSLSTN